MKTSSFAFIGLFIISSFFLAQTAWGVEDATTDFFSDNPADYCIKDLGDKYEFYGKLHDGITWNDLIPYSSIPEMRFQDLSCTGEEWVTRHVTGQRAMVVLHMICPPPDPQYPISYECINAHSDYSQPYIRRGFLTLSDCKAAEESDQYFKCDMNIRAMPVTIEMTCDNMETIKSRMIDPNEFDLYMSVITGSDYRDNTVDKNFVDGSNELATSNYHISKPVSLKWMLEHSNVCPPIISTPPTQPITVGNLYDPGKKLISIPVSPPPSESGNSTTEPGADDSHSQDMTPNDNESRTESAEVESTTPSCTLIR